MDLEHHSTNQLKVIKLKQMFAQKTKYFCHSVRFASIKECETKVGSAAKQKQEQKKVIQDQIRATRDQLKQLQTQLAAIK